MTMLEHVCAKCGKVLSIPDRFLGRDLKCTSCGQAFKVELVPEAPPVHPGPAPSDGFASFSAPPVPAATEFDVQQELTLQRFDIWSVVKIMALVNAGFGLLLGGIFALALATGSTLARNPFGMFFSVFVLIFAPIAYGVLGAVMAALGALIYNLLARGVGGITVRVSGLLPPVSMDEINPPAPFGEAPPFPSAGG